MKEAHATLSCRCHSYTNVWHARTLYFYRIRSLTRIFSIVTAYVQRQENKTKQLKNRIFTDGEFDEDDDDDDMHANTTENLHHMHNVMTAECEQHGMFLNVECTQNVMGWIYIYYLSILKQEF